MLAIIRREARRRGLANVACVEGRWEDVEAPSCDVAICSYVLPLIEDAAPFLAKLTTAAASKVFVTMNAVSTDVFLDTFWRHFHGAPRRAGPTYLDAAAVLAELDIAPDVEVVEVPVRVRFANLAGAVRHYREELLLADTPEVRRELRRVLEPWLVGKDGALRPPLRTTPVAILGWQTGRR